MLPALLLLTWALAGATDATCSVAAAKLKHRLSQDTAMIQKRQEVRAHRHQEERATSNVSTAAVGRPVRAHTRGAELSIGVGFDLVNTDLWSMRNNYPLDVYADDMPKSCFVEAPCSASVVKKTSDFSSINKWEQTFASSFGLKIEGGYQGFKGSISASTGMDAKNSWANEKDLTWSYISKTKRCYQLRSSCATNPAYLSKRAHDLLERLPFEGTDEATMELWRVAVVQNFGSHIAVKSSHGALVQSASSMDKSCKMSSACRKAESCLKLGYLEFVDASMCAKQDGCQKTDACSETLKAECAAVGGDPDLAGVVCGKEVTEAQLNEFLDSGDLGAASSTIGLALKPLHEVLIQMGFWRQGLQVKHATQYHSCKAPLGAWNSSGTSHACQCALQCKNGGVLDKNSCSCSCPGDDNHGFTGGDCSENYGKCVRGSGASGTPTARGRACVEGNFCGGVERSDHCGNTDVCCNRDEGGVCCPFGSSCKCWGAGQRFCKCKEGRNLWR